MPSWNLVSATVFAAALFHNVCAQSEQFLASVPSEFSNVSVALLEHNLAVIPGDWNVTDLESPFYNITTSDPTLAAALDQVEAAEFIAFDPSFLDIIGTSAKVERILAFPGVEHVHEAPVYVPETNELVFSDTSSIGWLYAINADTYVVRNLTTTPALYNVNGATYHKGKVYVCTNGSPTRGIYELDWNNGTATPVVNNFKGRKLNSPNDVVVDPDGNLWFTDPSYGWYSSWPFVTEPQLPNSVYFFNVTSGALKAVTNHVILVPNGLAFSADYKTLYVSDTNSTSGRPLRQYPTSIRNVIAFDVEGSILSNPRLIHQNEVGWSDGMRVTENGNIITGVTAAADVIDPRTGQLLGKIHCPGDIIFNVEPIAGTGTWFLTGQNYIYKVTIAEKALPRL